MLSTDVKILDTESAVAVRMRSYGRLFDRLTILILGTGERQVVGLSDSVRVLFPGGKSRREAFKNALWEGMREGRNLPADVVSVQDPFFVGFVGWRIAHALRAPLQVQIHTDFFNTAYAFMSVRKFVEVLLSMFIVSQASCVRVVSRRIERSIRFFGKKKLAVLPIRVFFSEETYTRPAEYGDGPVILMVARLEKEKRVCLAIDALSDIPDAHLYIVGDGSLRAKLEKQARNVALDTRVHFLGWRADLRPFYAHADVFLQLSLFEGYGLSLVEAGLASLPIISTDVGIIGDAYRNGESALVVSGSHFDTVSAITRLLRDSALRKRLGQKAHAAALSEMIDEETYLKRFKSTFEACAN